MQRADRKASRQESSMCSAVCMANGQEQWWALECQSSSVSSHKTRAASLSAKLACYNNRKMDSQLLSLWSLSQQARKGEVLLLNFKPETNRVSCTHWQLLTSSLSVKHMEVTLSKWFIQQICTFNNPTNYYYYYNTSKTKSDFGLKSSVLWSSLYKKKLHLMTSTCLISQDKKVIFKLLL